MTSLAFIGACGGAETQIIGPDTPTVASVQVTPTADTLTALGDTLRLQAVARGSSGNPISGVAFMWTSSDTQVLTVTASGLVTATGN